MISFTGNNDVTTDFSGYFPGSGTEITIAFWAQSNDVVNAQSVIGAADDPGGGGRINIHFPWSDGNIYWDFGAGGRISFAYPSNINSGWHHWVFISSGANYMAVYEDGSLLASQNSGATYSGNQILLLGDFEGFFYNGYLDDVCIYSRALSSSDVTDLYNSATGCVASTPPAASFTQFIVKLGQSFTVKLGQLFKTQ